MTYSTAEVCRLTGVTYRMLDYWSRLGAITAEHSEANGSGSQRRWSARQIPIVRVCGRLAALGANTTLMGRVAAYCAGIETELWEHTHLIIRGDGTCDLTNTVLDVDTGFVIRLAACLNEPKPARELDLISG